MRFRFQFSLKTMLWLTLVAGSFVGGMSVNERLVQRRQQEAVRKAEAALPRMRSLPVREQRIVEAAVLARLQETPTTPHSRN